MIDRAVIKFIWNDIVCNLIFYLVGILSILICVFLLKINPEELIISIIKGHFDVEIQKLPKVNNIMLYIIIYLLIFGMIYKGLVSKNKDREFHSKGIGYINGDYKFVSFLGRIFGYKKINIINVALWMQFKFCRSSYWDVSYDKLEPSNDAIMHEFIKGTHADTEVNLILEDTYAVREKLPVDWQLRDSYIISRDNEKGYRSYNEKFIKEVTKDINTIYTKEYLRMNIYGSLNPQHLDEIVKQNFNLSTRRRELEIYVYQSSGEQHKYLNGYKV